MTNNITVNMENLSDNERETLLSLIEKANSPVVSPFEKAPNDKVFFFIDKYGDVAEDIEEGDYDTECLRAVGNYCTDEELLQHRSLREVLNRLLWVYSMENRGNKISWEDDALIDKWYIYKDADGIGTEYLFTTKIDGVVFFASKAIADNAIEEVVKPFIKKHPDFVW